MAASLLPTLSMLCCMLLVSSSCRQGVLWEGRHIGQVGDNRTQLPQMAPQVPKGDTAALCSMWCQLRH